MKKPVLYGLGIVVVITLFIGASYNGILQKKAKLDTAWAQVETQYQRRFDLIPNLEATVSGAADFEKSTFTDVVTARNQWQNASSQTEKVQALNTFDSAVSRLLVTVEGYPQLQATQAFRDFMVQIEGTENRIAVSRKDYNDQVQVYNLHIQTFPRLFLASLFGFEAAPYFKSAQEAANAPVVDF